MKAQSLPALPQLSVVKPKPGLAVPSAVATAFCSYLAMPPGLQATGTPAPAHPVPMAEPVDVSEAVIAIVERSDSILACGPLAGEDRSTPAASDALTGVSAAFGSFWVHLAVTPVPAISLFADTVAGDLPECRGKDCDPADNETGRPQFVSCFPGQVLPVALPPAPANNGLLASAHDDPVHEKSVTLSANAMDAASASQLRAGATFLNIGPLVGPAPSLAQGFQPPAAVLFDRHLDLARGDAWLDNLAGDIAALAGRGGLLKFALLPPAIGRLDVEVMRRGEGINVHLVTQNKAAHDVLAAAQPRLVEEIRAQGIRVTGAEVSTGGASGREDFAGSRSRRFQPPLIEAASRAAEHDLSPTRSPATDGCYA